MNTPTLSSLVTNVLNLIDGLPDEARAELHTELLRRRQSAIGKLGGGAVGDRKYYQRIAMKGVEARRKKAALVKSGSGN